MSDGASINKGGMLLCTDSFTIPHVIKLMNVLNIKYNLHPTLQFYGKGKYPRIYILAKELPLLKSIVKSHIHSFSMYKLSGGKIKKEKI